MFRKGVGLIFQGTIGALMSFDLPAQANTGRVVAAMGIAQSHVQQHLRLIANKGLCAFKEAEGLVQIVQCALGHMKPA